MDYDYEHEQTAWLEQLKTVAYFVLACLVLIFWNSNHDHH